MKNIKASSAFTNARTSNSHNADAQALEPSKLAISRQEQSQASAPVHSISPKSIRSEDPLWGLAMERQTALVRTASTGSGHENDRQMSQLAAVDAMLGTNTGPAGMRDGTALAMFVRGSRGVLGGRSSGASHAGALT